MPTCKAEISCVLHAFTDSFHAQCVSPLYVHAIKTRKTHTLTLILCKYFLHIITPHFFGDLIIGPIDTWREDYIVCYKYGVVNFGINYGAKQ